MNIGKGIKPGEAIKQLEAEIKTVKSTDEFQRYMNFIAQFHQYSFHNQMLIAIQNPNASLVKGFVGWKKMGRYPKAGTAIRILAPMSYKKEVEKSTGVVEEISSMYFKFVCVFDIKDTDGDPLPEYSIETKEESDFLGNLSQLCKDYNVKLSFQYTGSAYGVSKLGAIDVRDNIAEADKVHVTLHEIFHEKLHGMTERMELSKQQKEFEAECCTYIVCTHFNLPQTAAKYLATYGDYNLLNSLERISEVSKEVIARLENIKQSNESIL